MKAGHYYYDPNTSTLFVGFARDGKLHGKVIYSQYCGFPKGYKYDDWNEGIFINRRAVNGSYREFLDSIDPESEGSEMLSDMNHAKTKALLNTRKIVKKGKLDHEDIFFVRGLWKLEYR